MSRLSRVAECTGARCRRPSAWPRACADAAARVDDDRATTTARVAGAGDACGGAAPESVQSQGWIDDPYATDPGVADHEHGVPAPLGREGAQYDALGEAHLPTRRRTSDGLSCL